MRTRCYQQSQMSTNVPTFCYKVWFLLKMSDNGRFGSATTEIINSAIDNTTPKNTKKTKTSIWRQFELFCREKGYELLPSTSQPEISNILADWAYNMKKSDGNDYKECVIKTMWNTVAKIVQEKYYMDYKIVFDPFKDVTFQVARNAKNAKRKQLQSNLDKRRQSSIALSKEEVIKMAEQWDENTPMGLQKKLFHIAAFELAWRGGESAQCKIYYFKAEKHNNGTLTGRVEYNTVFSKTAQGGDKRCSESKWLTTNKENLNVCPVRLLKKLLEKRNKHISSDRLFLTPNPFWKNENAKGWYKNVPIGVNEISKWTRISAEKIGLDVKNKITNHSHRASTISTLAKAGVSEQQIIKLTGHSNANSLKPYLQLDSQHHSTLVTNLREENNQIQQSSSGRIVYQNCTFTNCTLK